MSPKRSAALLSLVGVGQSLTNIWAARADQQQAEINQAWAAVEQKMQEAALNRQYIADAAEYEARAAANGHSYGNYAGHRLQLNTNRQRDIELSALRAESQAATEGLVAANKRFSSGLDSAFGGFGNIAKDALLKAKIAELEYEDYHVPKTRIDNADSE